MLNEPHGAALKVGPHATRIVEPRQARKGATVRRPSRVPWEYLTGAGSCGEIAVRAVRRRVHGHLDIHEQLSGPRAEVAAADVRGGRRPGRDHAHAAERARLRPHRARVPLRRARAGSARPPPRACWPGRSCARAQRGPSPAARATRARDAAAASTSSRSTAPPTGGIEEIRTLRENVKYAPSRGRYKVYIIDEVHQLTEARLQRAAEDAGGAAAPRGLRPGHHRPARHPGRPSSRACSASTSARSRPTCWRRRSSASCARRRSRSSRPRCRPSCARPRARCATRSRCSTPPSPTATAGSRRTPPPSCSARPRRPRCAPSRRRCSPTTPAPRWRRSTARPARARTSSAFTRDVIELLRRALVLKAAPTTKLADLAHAEGNELRALGESRRARRDPLRRSARSSTPTR